MGSDPPAPTPASCRESKVTQPTHKTRDSLLLPCKVSGCACTGVSVHVCAHMCMCEREGLSIFPVWSVVITNADKCSSDKCSSRNTGTYAVSLAADSGLNVVKIFRRQAATRRWECSDQGRQGSPLCFSLARRCFR